MNRSFICIVSLVLFFLASCQEKEIAVKTVYVTPSIVSIAEGATASLSVSVDPEDAIWSTVDWESRDNSIATVTKRGTITGVKVGKTIITAVVNGVSGACEVTVYKDVISVTGVTLSEKTLNIGVGDTKTLNADVSPSGATDKSLEWTSSNPSVATVDAGKVKGVAKGECDITVKTADGGFEDKCHVTVTETPVQSIAFKDGSGYAIIVDGGSSRSLEIEFNPSFASNKNVTFESDDESIATVSGGAVGKGTVTFKTGKYGPVIITAKSEVDSRTASQVFFVKGPEPIYTAPEGTLFAGRKEKYVFNTAAYPTATGISWSAGSKTVSGAEAMLAVEKGDSEVVLSAVFSDLTVQFAIPVTVEEFWMNVSLPMPSSPRNTYPVFNKECTKAYFITRGSPRSLFELDLEGRKLGWRFTMPGANSNGGDICLIPATGDIICGAEKYVYCITPDGSVKWQMEVASVNNSPSSLSGNGPSLSNDQSVVFAPCTDNWFYALDASTGAVLDKYQFANAACQVAVYGDDEIVILQRLTENGIIFLQFKDGKFTENAVIDSPVKTASDIITPCIDRDQSKIFFQAEGYTFSVDLKQRKLAYVPTVSRNGYHWSGCITTDGILCQPEQSPTRIEVIGVNEDITEASNWRLAFEIKGVTNLLNHGGIACDDDGNIYFFINESSGASFYKLNRNGSSYSSEKLSTVPNIPEAQGFFAFGGGYLVGGGGNTTESYVYVRCVDAERGSGWSGAGGDAQATKNANLIYGN